mmetsp:Transcript_4158/g.10593  ORF Transcript_4158/g.10593 Transcript_4158/m.10593 type:complete len:80 (-) Transcript_4158:238-477(-)
MTSSLGLNVQVLCDGEDDQFSTEFAAWPIRLFGFKDGEVRWIADASDCNFEVGDLRRWLEDNCAQSMNERTDPARNRLS